MVAIGDRVCRVLDVEDPDVLEPVLEIVEHGFVQHHEQVAIGHRQAVVRAALEWRRPVDVAGSASAWRGPATSMTTRPASRQAPQAMSPLTIAWCRPNLALAGHVGFSPAA